jgi:hypothetical protein
MNALRAEVARLQELVAVKDQLLTCKDQLLTSKEAQLAMKEELVASKEAQLASQGELLASRTEGMERLQTELQLRDASLDDNSKRQRVHNNSSNSSSCCCAALSPLDKNELLDHVFSYAGGGDHLFIAGVSRRWRGRYLRHCIINSCSKFGEKFVTRHRSAIITESRLQLALISGLSVAGWSFASWSYASPICKHSLQPEKVLAVLRLHGVPWDQLLCSLAAANDKLALLKWLKRSGCPWSIEVLYDASSSGSVAMLEWVLSVAPTESAIDKQGMLACAGWCDKLAAAKWLRAHGAYWPEKFVGQYSDGAQYDTAKQCWSLATVQWAIASGSGWREWRCDDYAATTFTNLAARSHAAAVLQWAHANGCPCTCEHAQQQQ